MSACHELKLHSAWVVRFQVKQRHTGTQGASGASVSKYSKKEFLDSFIAVGDTTHNFAGLLERVSAIPPFGVRRRGIVTVFRDGIDPLYEDPQNSGGFSVRFGMTRGWEELGALLQKWDDARKADRERVRMKIHPCVPIEDIDRLVYLFLTLVLAGFFDADGVRANGVYVKTEFGLVSLEVWFNRHDRRTENNTRAKFVELLGRLDYNLFDKRHQENLNSDLLR